MQAAPEPLRDDQLPSGIAETMRWMQQWFDFVQAVFNDANQRIDWLVQQSGTTKEKIDDIEQAHAEIIKRLDQSSGLIETQTRIVQGVTKEIDIRMQVVRGDADRIERAFGEISARYQQSINELRSDWDERMIGHTNEVKEMILHLDNEQRAAMTQLRTDVLERRRDETQVVTARIGRSERVAIAVIAALTSLITGIAATLATLAAHPH